MGNFEREGGEKKVGGAYASDEKAEGAEKEGFVVTMSDLKREWGVWCRLRNCFLNMNIYYSNHLDMIKEVDCVIVDLKKIENNSILDNMFLFHGGTRLLPLSAHISHFITGWDYANIV